MAHVERLSHVPETALARELGVDWTPHEENTARLYEVLHHWLGLEWIDRTTDPDDPEVRRRRAEDKRNRVQPPPYPLVPPVALRPGELSEKRHQAYLAEVQRWSEPKVERRHVTTDEFDRFVGVAQG